MPYSLSKNCSFGPLTGLLLTALALTASAGCSTVRVDPDPDPDPDPPIDAGFTLPGKCAGPSLPYDGPLCGPPDRPCSLLANELVISTRSARYTSPGIVLDTQGAPHIVASENNSEESNRGFYARRDASGAWTAPEETPFPVFALALVPGSSGELFALINGGDGNASLRARTPEGQWSDAAPLPGKMYVAPGDFACDSDGTFHAALGSTGYALQYGRYKKGWIVDTFNTKGKAPPPLALSTSGGPQITYWDDATQTEPKLFWRPFPADPELVDTITLSTQALVTNAALTLTVAPPDSQNPEGRPFILYSRPVNDKAIRKEIVYATRDGAGSWQISPPLAQEIHKYCGSDPAPTAGAMCINDYGEVSPIAVIASQAGDVRFLYVKRSRKDLYNGSCSDAQPPVCKWVEQPGSSTYEGDLYMAWVDENKQVGTARLAESMNISGATAVLDASGKIHVALYDSRAEGEMKPQSLYVVRYLQIGP
jgi:hypothetical protein